MSSVRPKLFAFVVAASLAVLAGCATYDRHGLCPAAATEAAAGFRPAAAGLSPELRRTILGLDPEHVTTAQVRDVLSHAPAPRIINIHGGIAPVQLHMISFSKFLVGMGYPERSITNPTDGTYTFSCYENSRMIAGMIAWYYEQEGLRPMIVGHSQGGMQAVKILHLLAGSTNRPLEVWNPLTWQSEHRTEFRDPFTGSNRPVVGLQVPYATAVASGGTTRLLPNQWNTLGRLREIPNSVEEFTGFYKSWDHAGGDFLGWGKLNHYESMGTARVRTVKLPWWYKHGKIPDTQNLPNCGAVRDWIDSYEPPTAAFSEPSAETGMASVPNILWAADVWHSIKRHWVLELQRALHGGTETSAKPS